MLFERYTNTNRMDIESTLNADLMDIERHRTNIATGAMVIEAKRVIIEPTPMLHRTKLNNYRSKPSESSNTRRQEGRMSIRIF
jgi:hypothetical protein